MISAGLHQAMRLTDYACSSMVGCGFSILAVPVSCFPVVVSVFCCCVFFACGHPASGMSVTLLPVDVVKVKSYVQSFFVPSSVCTRRVLINKLYLVPKRIVAGFVDMFWKGENLSFVET